MKALILEEDLDPAATANRAEVEVAKIAEAEGEVWVEAEVCEPCFPMTFCPRTSKTHEEMSLLRFMLERVARIVGSSSTIF